MRPRTLPRTGVVAVAFFWIATVAPDTQSASAAGYYFLSTDSMTLSPSGSGRLLDDGETLLMWSNGTASATVEFPEGDHYDRLGISARADLCEGAPELEVTIDGEAVLSAIVSVSSQAYATYTGTGSWGPGLHTLEVSYTNDHRTATCDRNLKLTSLQFFAGKVTPRMTLDMNDFAIDATAGSRFSYGGDGTTGIALWRNTTATMDVWTQGVTRVEVLAGRDWCPGAPAPHLRLELDGQLLGDVELVPDRIGDRGYIGVPAAAPATGYHELRLSFPNSSYTPACDTNLKIYVVVLTGTTT